MPIEDVNAPPTTKKVKAPVGVGQPQEGSFVQDYLALRRQKNAEKLIENEMGGAKPPPDAPSLSTTIVTNAMATQEAAIKRAEDSAEANDGKVEKYREEARLAGERVHEVQIDQLAKMMGTINSTMEDIKRGAQPKTAIETIQEAEALLTLMHSKVAPTAPAAPAVDTKLTLELEQMKQNHEMAIKHLDMELAKMNQEFQLKMAEFSDGKALRWREYEDKKAFRHDGLTGFQDLIGAVSQGISQDMGVSGGAEESMGASVSNFPCEFCGTTIEVPPGGGKVTCPNPECKAEFNISKKG